MSESRWTWRRFLPSDENPLSGRLGRRLLAWFLLFSLGPLFVSNTVGYLKSQEIIEGIIQRDLLALAQVEAQHIHGQMERYLLDLQALAAGNEFLVAGTLRADGRDPGRLGAAAPPEAVANYLERKNRELAAFEALFIGRNDGSILISTRPVNAEVPGFHLAATAPVVMERLQGRAAGGEPRFRLCVPLRDAEGRPIGRLGGVIGQRGLATFLDIPEQLSGFLESYIVDEYGRPLFASHGHDSPDHSLPVSTPLRNMEPRAFARYTTDAGREVIATSVEIQGLTWRYIAQAPIAAALGPLRLLRGISVLLEAMLAVALVIGAWIVAGQIVAPVRRLVSAARRVGAGDLEVRVESAGRDEIGALGDAFNEMTRELADASERVQELHQREIQRAQQLATVGELASGVAHELKNPLVGVSNGMDLVRRRIGPNPAVEPIMEEMSRQLDRMHGAVRDLLAFARPAEPTLGPVDANHVLERTARLVGAAAERAGISPELSLTHPLPLILADEELLCQALVNLAMNAVQATGEGGKVILSTHRGEERDVEIRIADTGRGIPPGELEHIFKPFHTTRHSGTGLGLSITKEIVERHGGRIGVQSRLGGGSAFSVHLPLPSASAIARTVDDAPLRRDVSPDGEATAPAVANP